MQYPFIEKFIKALNKAKWELYNQQGRTVQAEDLAEKLRKIEVSLENETITINQALAKAARLLKDTEINLVNLLICA